MSAGRMYEILKAKLARVVPDIELRYKAEIAEEIVELKKKRNAVILAHNYMEPALFYSIADFTGDSLDLSRKAATTDKDIIVFCGVRFMAETAKILSPDKTVLLPAEKAGCSLAESITADDVREIRRQFPDAPVVTYVNTYADVKAETDICCTSGNARAVIESLNSERIIFIPDRYLAANTARTMGKNIVFPKRTEKGFSFDPIDSGFIGWDGSCEVHERFTVADVSNARRQFPDVLVLAHPECPEAVCRAADYSGGTNGMIKFIQNSKAKHILLLTECSMADNVAAANPDKDLIRICSIRCPHMNLITLEDTLAALQHNRFEITVPEDISRRARKAVERMIAIG